MGVLLPSTDAMPPLPAALLRLALVVAAASLMWHSFEARLNVLGRRTV